MFVWTTLLPALPLRIRPKDEPADRGDAPDAEPRADRPATPSSQTRRE
jgi:hypothetical protein